MVEPTPEWAETLWAAFRAGELGWQVERDAHGEAKGEILWIARRVTPALTERWAVLRLGGWVLIEVDHVHGTSAPVHATQWPHKPGRLGPKREPAEDVPIPIPW